jgi:hypothetical protein
MSASCPALADESPELTLDGVPVRAIWQVANFMNPGWFTSQPVFTSQGSAYEGGTSLGATKPGNDEPIDLQMTWTVARIEDAPSAIEGAFVFPAGSRFLVTGVFSRNCEDVETYSAVLVNNDRLTTRSLGYKNTEGTIVPETTSLPERVYSELGIRGPFTSQIIVPPPATGGGQ